MATRIDWLASRANSRRRTQWRAECPRGLVLLLWGKWAREAPSSRLSPLLSSRCGVRPRLPSPFTSHDGGTVDLETSRSAPPVLVWCLYIVIYLFSFTSSTEMTRWIPTKKEKYGVGKSSKEAPCVGLVESSASELPNKLNFKGQDTLELRNRSYMRLLLSLIHGGRWNWSSSGFPPQTLCCYYYSRKLDIYLPCCPGGTLDMC